MNEKRVIAKQTEKDQNEILQGILNSQEWGQGQKENEEN